jgi:hypothetical protein
MYAKRGGGWPRGRGGRGRGGRGGFSNQPRGLFTDGQWLCTYVSTWLTTEPFADFIGECTPRLPAEHFKVKKEGPNTGRWFWTCQKRSGDEKGCSFFLWDDDAKPREEAAVLNNSRSEPQPAQAGPSTSDTRAPAGLRRSSPPPAYTEFEARLLDDGQLGDDDETQDEEDGLPWTPTAREQTESRRPASGISPPPITPRKPEQTVSFQTPADSNGKRKISEVDDVHYPGLPTPNTSGRHLGRFEDRPVNLEASEHASTLTTPTPSRFRDALSSPEPAMHLTEDVLNVLQERNVRLSDDARTSLRELLLRHSRRVQGIISGRDLSRTTIKARDAKIAEQQYRISTLEAELEAERALVRHLRLERQDSHDDG